MTANRIRTPRIVERVMAYASLGLPPLFWAGNFIVSRAVRDLTAPLTLLTVRWVVAFVCLSPFALPIMRRDAPRYWQHRWLMLGTALTGIVGFNALIYVGVRTTTASNALLMNALIPLMIVFFGAIFYRQRLTLAQGAGLILSLLGVFTLVLHGQWSQWSALALVPGDAVVLAAMACFAFYTLWIRRLPADLDRLGVLGAHITIGVCLLLPLWFIAPISATSAHWTISFAAAALYVGIFPSVLAYLLYMRAVRFFGAERAGLSIHLIPAFGVILSTLFLHERLHLWHATGIVAIALGLVCSSFRQASAPPTNGGDVSHVREV
ncbi:MULTISPECIES: DMT family transporter [Acetobacteraceae]|uniref:EamA/RhaT family transporter n=4 Tax=Acetobacteraceae TaxID=433 RepID=A0A094ZRI3_9PROT|nr:MULTISPECIES: DMT family transporter [Acetobacteraceae]ASL40964.1 EamA family transporter [Acetobacter oryzifermentans]ATJ91683.1 EamA/RhaT family transporter [Acetobacter tropicalis]KAA8385222.1 DMT family transporter [Acetobacter tropicalis]KAA8386551.1 DMT family transporter [Acetobacter sp. DmW_136]KAA8389793.1 DMT family transporter [Acetobacter tropicalis]